MTTELHGKHRLGGKHSDPICMKLPHPAHNAKHSAHHLMEVPPSPSRPPTAPIPPVRLPIRAVENPANIASLSAAPNTASIPVITGVLTLQPIRPWRNRGRVAAAALATGSIILAGTGALVSIEPASSSREAAAPIPEPVTSITAPKDAVIKHPSVKVRTIPAPPPVAPSEPVVVAQPPVQPPRVIVPAPAPPIVRAVPAPAPPPPPPPPNLSRAQRIVSAALGQVGETQDCVKMVADSLAAVSIYWYKWPHEYYQIGRPVSAAQALPGDLIYYVYGSTPGSLAHIAVYIGNGQAVHGGWNGNQTVVFSVNVGSGPQYIRLY